MTGFTIDLCSEYDKSKLLMGEPDRFSYIPYVEANYKIDCSMLNRFGAFSKSQNVEMTIYGKFKFYVEFEKSHQQHINDRIKFEYVLNDERLITKSFEIVWLQRTFGKQPYFICPDTGKRVKHLLIVNGLIKSRHYFKKMNYYSEHEAVRDRCLRAARKIRRRYKLEECIDCPINDMPKPPNIHYSTWDRWCEKEYKYFVFIEDEMNRLLINLT